MNDNAGDKLYTAKDIEKYLGINANTLYHWVQVRRLVKPKIEVRGRGKSHKFDKENMATLLLTKVLHGYQIELSHLEYLYKDIISTDYVAKKKVRLTDSMGEGGINIWRIFKSNPAEHRKDGYYLYIVLELAEDLEKALKLGGPGIGKAIGIRNLDGIKEMLDFIKEGRVYGRQEERNVSIISIDLVAIIRNLERILGIEF